MKSRTVKILALLLAFCTVFGVASCSLTSSDEEVEETTTLASATKLPSAEEEILAYFNSCFAAAKAGKAAVKYSSGYKPGSFDCENATLKAALPTLSKLMKKGYNADLGAEVEYGGDFAKLLPIKGSEAPLVLTKSDIVDIAVNPDEFSRYDEQASIYAEKIVDDKEYTTAYVETDPDVRKITITLKDEIDPKAGEGFFGQIFDIPDRAAIDAEMDKAKSYIDYNGKYTAKYTGCSIYMEIDRLTDQVIKVEFRRNIEITASVTGLGTLADLGTAELSFVMAGNDCYEFDWIDPETVTETD